MKVGEDGAGQGSRDPDGNVFLPFRLVTCACYCCIKYGTLHCNPVLRLPSWLALSAPGMRGAQPGYFTR